MYSWELLKRYFTLSSTQQSSFLTCGCFCVSGLIHHKPFQNITAKPATFDNFRIVCGFFNVSRRHFKHGRYCETGPSVYSPYPRRLKPFANVITKVALISQLF